MKILIVEDQLKLSRHLRQGLTEPGTVVTCVHTAAAAHEVMGRGVPDVVVLDLMLPDRDGLDLLRQWRQQRIDCPVLILSARNTVKDRIDGLERGADDYLPKPFSIEELRARVRALARRKSSRIEQELNHRELSLNLATGTVTLNGVRLELTARELALLEIFMQNTGQVLTRSMLAAKVWTMDYDVDSNLLEVYMSRLRTKIENRAGRHFFETIRGMGYRMM